MSHSQKRMCPIYRCPTCGVEAHIDKEKREVVIYLPPVDIPHFKPSLQFSTCFPNHADCELVKPVDKINLKTLERIE